MTLPKPKQILSYLVLATLTSPVLATPNLERELELQREELEQIRLEEQIQRNQREIERRRDQLSRPQQESPPVVVVERERRGPDVPSIIFGGILGYGLGRINNNHYHYHYRRHRACSWGSGYRGCYHRKDNLQDAVEGLSIESKGPSPITGSDTIDSVIRNFRTGETTTYGTPYGFRFMTW